jgi:hypothetical protein
MSSDSEPDEANPTPTDRETREILGLFDAPAFARRGRDVEFALAGLRGICVRERIARLEMISLRLRQWCSIADPGGWIGVLEQPIDDIWHLALDGDPPYADSSALPSRRLRVARDLIHSVERFNRLWLQFLEGLNLDPLNQLIEQYNRYYLLEKECSLGSVRAAARSFRPIAPLTLPVLRQDYPLLPLPRLVVGKGGNIASP